MSAPVMMSDAKQKDAMVINRTGIEKWPISARKKAIEPDMRRLMQTCVERAVQKPNSSSAYSLNRRLFMSRIRQIRNPGRKKMNRMEMNREKVGTNLKAKIVK